MPACVGDCKMEIILLKEINTLPVSWSKFHKQKVKLLLLPFIYFGFGRLVEYA